nr:uncharacterized protein LOC104118765 [Nicotiana tomentosiformis]
MAEYEACILGLRVAIDINIQELLVIEDSDLLVHQAVTKIVADFVWDRIVCQFGVPEAIITNNAANLNSGLMKAMCETFKIKHQNSTAYRPQMNRAVEVANKNIKKILRKMVDKYKQWYEKIPFSLLEYRTTVRTSTGQPPTYSGLWYQGRYPYRSGNSFIKDNTIGQAQRRGMGTEPG